MGQGTEAWTSDQTYEPFIGRWSRLVAPEFLRLLPGPPGMSWCDVGCGTGALAQAILATERPARVLGVDPAEPYLAAARRGGVAETVVGSATAIPAGDGEFDRVVAALVLNFVPEPAAALREMRRVARPSGWVGGYLWDYAEGMQLLRLFWDAAVALDPAAAALDEGVRFPLCRPAPLRALFEGVGLAEVVVEPIEVPTVFRDFADFWQPFLGGQGPAPGYCATLSDQRRDALRDTLRANLGGREIALTARAWAVRGQVPASGRDGV